MLFKTVSKGLKLLRYYYNCFDEEWESYGFIFQNWERKHVNHLQLKPGY